MCFITGVTTAQSDSDMLYKHGYWARGWEKKEMEKDWEYSPGTDVQGLKLHPNFSKSCATHAECLQKGLPLIAVISHAKCKLKG